MEHQSHSTYSGPDGHTVTVSIPGHRVYIDMTSSSEKPKVCYKSPGGHVVELVDALDDETHYRFECRCGCAAQFAGFGKDVKAAARIGRPVRTPPIARPSGDNNSHEHVDHQVREFAMKVRPFVSDRYIQKSMFNLTDDQIDDLATKKNEVDPVIAAGGGQDGRDPPEVGATVRSKSTGDGPFTVVDFTNSKIIIGEEKQEHLTWCGVLRTTSGNYTTLPVADLVKVDEPRAFLVDPRTYRTPVTGLVLKAGLALVAAWTAAVIGLGAYAAICL